MPCAWTANRRICYGTHSSQPARLSELKLARAVSMTLSCKCCMLGRVVPRPGPVPSCACQIQSDQIQLSAKHVRSAVCHCDVLERSSRARFRLTPSCVRWIHRTGKPHLVWYAFISAGQTRRAEAGPRSQHESDLHARAGGLHARAGGPAARARAQRHPPNPIGSDSAVGQARALCGRSSRRLGKKAVDSVSDLTPSRVRWIHRAGKPDAR